MYQDYFTPLYLGNRETFGIPQLAYRESYMYDILLHFKNDKPLTAKTSQIIPSSKNIKMISGSRK